MMKRKNQSLAKLIPLVCVKPEPFILYKKLAGSEANSLGLKRTRSYSACKQTLMVKN